MSGIPVDYSPDPCNDVDFYIDTLIRTEMREASVPAHIVEQLISDGYVERDGTGYLVGVS